VEARLKILRSNRVWRDKNGRYKQDPVRLGDPGRTHESTTLCTTALTIPWTFTVLPEPCVCGASRIFTIARTDLPYMIDL
jgi:hypothetical protein